MKTNIIKIFSALIIVLFLFPSCTKEPANTKSSQDSINLGGDEAGGFIRDTFDWD